MGKRATATPQLRIVPDSPQGVDARTRHELIAQAAYFRAQRRGFEAGHEHEDWLAAEAEIDAALGFRGSSATPGAT
jgi:Protein of unknown function (DUF2934)